MATAPLAVPAAPKPAHTRYSNPNLRTSTKSPQPFDPAELTRRLELYELERKASKDLRRKSTGQNLSSRSHRAPRPNTELFDPDALTKSVQYHQKHDADKALRRRSAGELTSRAAHRSRLTEPFESEQLKRKLEAHQRALAKLEQDGGSTGDTNNDSGVSLNKSARRSRHLSSTLSPKGSVMDSRSTRESMVYQPRSAHTSFIRTTTALNQDYINIHHLAEASLTPYPVVNDANRRRSQMLDDGGKSRRANRNRTLHPQDISLATLSGNQRNLNVKTLSTENLRGARHSAIFDENEAAKDSPEEFLSPTIREPKDRPNWSQQDEPDPSNRDKRRSRRSFPWHRQSTAYAHEREAAIAAENEAARQRHSSYGATQKPASQKSSSTTNKKDPEPKAPPVDGKLENRSSIKQTEADMREKAVKDDRTRKGYQEKIKEQRKAVSRSSKPIIPPEPVEPALRSPSSMVSMKSAKSVGTVMTTTSDIARRASLESMTPDSLALFREQERRLKDLQRRQSLASEKYARRKYRQEEKERPDDGRSDAVSIFGDKLEGMTPESIRLLREREKLVRWRAEREKEEFEKRAAQQTNTTTMRVPDAEATGEVAIEKKKSGGLLCCFRS